MKAYIVASSDFEQDAERRLRWGDHWLKAGIARALEAQGWTVDASITDATEVLIHCYGGQTIGNLPAHTYNVLYIHSHPARLANFDFGMYDRVVAGSERLAERLRERGIAAAWNVGATDFVPLDVPLEHDVVFVGNNRGAVGDQITRPVITALGDLTTLPFKLEVWGEGWEMLPASIWQGKYYPNEELNALYSGSAVVLNDTHADMVEAGIINPRVLDAQMAGAWVIGPKDNEDRRGICEARIAAARQGEGPIFAQPNTYAALVFDLVGGIEPRVRVDLGCGNHKREGYVGIDKVAGEGVDIVWDIRNGLPVTHGVDYAVADNLMEHIGAEFVGAMNGVHDALTDDGRFAVTVPGAHAPAAAFADPTHVRYFVPETWDYFDVNSERWRDYGKSYGIKPWKVLRRGVRDRFIDVVLTPARGSK